MIVFLESKNVILSPISLSLIQNHDYLKWINNQQSDLFTQHAIFPNTLEGVNAYAEIRQKNKNCIWLGIIYKENKKHIGNIDISDIDWINRVGTYNILIGEKNCHGKGIGYEASHLIINHAFTRLNLNRIQLGVNEKNVGAIKLYEKLGYKYEGLFRSGILSNGVYTNVIRMGLLSSEYSFDCSII